MKSAKRRSISGWIRLMMTLQMDVSMDPYLRGFRSGAAYVIDFLTDKIKEEQEAKR